HKWIAKLSGDKARLLDRVGDPVLRLLELELVEQQLETIAVLGQIDRVRRCAEDRHVGLFERLGELERGLPAELHDHAMQRAVATLGVDNLQYVFRSQRFEIQSVRG